MLAESQSRFRVAAVAVSALALLLMIGQRADAAFPGRDGTIVSQCDPGICALAPDGSIRSRLSSFRSDFDPDFSADGRRIAFTRSRAGNRGQSIFLMRRTGKVIDSIAPPELPQVVTGPVLMPSSDRVLVGSQQGIYSVRIADDEVTQLTTAADQEPAVSPDGSRIAFLRPHADDPGSFRLWIMDSDGSDKRPLTGSTAEEKIFSVDWSPDGERLLIDRLGPRVDGGRGDGAFLVNPDGTGLVHIDGTGLRTSDPTFSPSGRRIAFKDDRVCNGFGECGTALVVRGIDDGPKRTVGIIGSNGTRSLDWGPRARTPAPSARCNGKRATIVGTGRSDDIVGTPGRDVIAAGVGRDRILGRGGDDVICGGPTQDLIEGGPGRDFCSSAERARSCELD